jgi:hypothetical protein
LSGGFERLNENFSISTEMNEQPTTCADRSTEKLKRPALIYERRADRNKWAALRVHPVQGQRGSLQSPYLWILHRTLAAGRANFAPLLSGARKTINADV